jgi:hypothetical protein
LVLEADGPSPGWDDDPHPTQDGEFVVSDLLLQRLMDAQIE